MARSEAGGLPGGEGPAGFGRSQQAIRETFAGRLRLVGDERCAFGPNEELVDILNPRDFTQWHRSGDVQRSRSGLVCRWCRQPVHITYRKSDGGVWISHNASDDGDRCARRTSSAGETAEHTTLKYWCRDRLKALGATVAVDEYQVGARKTDVYAELGSRALAIEVQWSSLSRDDVHRHTAELAARGCSVVWLTWHCTWLTQVPALAIDKFWPDATTATALEYSISQGLLFANDSGLLAPRRQKQPLGRFFERWAHDEMAWGYRKINRGGWATVRDWEQETKRQTAVIATHESTIAARDQQIAGLNTTIDRQTIEFAEMAVQHADELMVAQSALEEQRIASDELAQQAATNSELTAAASTVGRLGSEMSRHLRALEEWRDAVTVQFERPWPFWRRPALPPRSRDEIATLRRQFERINNSDYSSPHPIGVESLNSAASWWETRRWANTYTDQHQGRERKPRLFRSLRATRAVRAERKRSNKPVPVPPVRAILLLLVASVALIGGAVLASDTVLAWSLPAAGAGFIAAVMLLINRRTVKLADQLGGEVTLFPGHGCVELTNWTYLPRVGEGAARARNSAYLVVRDVLHWADENGVHLAATAATEWHAGLYRCVGFSEPQTDTHKIHSVARSAVWLRGQSAALIRPPGCGKPDIQAVRDYLDRASQR
ncbi:competence protein CoiA family protein [Nocardia sp. NPDC003183]